MTKLLTENDRKILKYEKRIGYVFAGLILSFGALFNLFYFIQNFYSRELMVIVLVNSGILCLAYFVCYIINRNANQDLKGNVKFIYTRLAEKKTIEKSNEAGSGNLFIPILGNLFPKLWGHKMREMNKYLIYSNGNKYEVNEDLYNKIAEGSYFDVHYASNSQTVLSLTTDKI